jgi:hypothetical protein
MPEFSHDGPETASLTSLSARSRPHCRVCGYTPRSPKTGQPDAGCARLRTLIGQVNLVEFIGRFTRLRGYGRELRGRCIFHLDRSPSLVVNSSRGVWRCFAGCGGGSAYDFLLHLGLPPKESVRILARLAAGKFVDLPTAPQASEGRPAPQLPGGPGGPEVPLARRPRSGKVEPLYLSRWSFDLGRETFALPASMRGDLERSQ